MTSRPRSFAVKFAISESKTTRLLPPYGAGGGSDCIGWGGHSCLPRVCECGSVRASAERTRIGSGDQNVPIHRFDGRQECPPHLELPALPKNWAHPVFVDLMDVTLAASGRLGDILVKDGLIDRAVEKVTRAFATIEKAVRTLYR